MAVSGAFVTECIQSLQNPSIRSSIYLHARQDYPNECCGIIYRSGPRRCRNCQDELHASNPVLYARTAKKAFALDAHDVLRMAESLETSDPALAIYHSHIDIGSHFSDHDVRSAMWSGRPAYPSLCHLVIDCRKDAIAGARLYAFDEQSGSFREVACFPGDRI